MVTTPGTTLSRSFPGSRLVVVALVTVAAALAAGYHAYETAEIDLSSFVLGLFTPGSTYFAADRPAVYFGLGTSHPLGLAMTPECTSVFLVLPLIFVGAVMIALRPRVTARVLIALMIGGAILVVVNQLRILTLALLVGWLGTDRGYYWGHTMVGSLISVIGGAVALVLFVWLATRDKKTGSA